MPMVSPKVERIDDRLNLLLGELGTQLSPRVIDRGFIPYENRPQAELTKGVLNVFIADEGGYSKALGMATKEGITSVMLVAHIQVAESATTDALLQAELDFYEEVKAVVAGGLIGLDVALVSAQFSRLMEFPVGWFVAVVTLGSPRAGTH